MDFSPELVGNVVAALVTMIGFSFLYRENRLYRVVEHIIVGMALGVGLVIVVSTVRGVGFVPLWGGRYEYIVPILLGVLLFAGFSKRYAHLRRLSNAVLAGIGSGLVLRGIVGAQIIGQIVGMAPMIGKDLSSSFSGIVMFTGTVSCLLYFIFTRPKAGIAASASRSIDRTLKIGRGFIMVALGANFGSYVLSTSTFIVDRVQFLLLTRPLEYVVVPGFVIAVFLIWRDSRKARQSKRVQ
jgi:hypothetical protein